ncbi:complement C1q tumor necrosis factor-related protein 6 isoform X1 [Acipenser oxyrinchus oxyrinchus]|uniref:Complement C1q tumor necrosis factor-related protein 6 isoform X1 n=1 Tax=Acipenser oxyrinchus oxyrinchus TaxID=40147 RepID=A0AAD8CFZ5_ACIOX|nr:complement C1q tumor necrosis factor-related protein 6 isoform X1 [Acipenser oxyrinchus oxyrinchus]
MFSLCLPLLLLLPLSQAAPPSDAPPPQHCARCCDHLEYQSSPPEGADTPPAGKYIVPEIRPYINMTILKGKDSQRRPGERHPGKSAKDGPPGSPRTPGPKGSKGQTGVPEMPASTSTLPFRWGARKPSTTPSSTRPWCSTRSSSTSTATSTCSGRFLCHLPGSTTSTSTCTPGTSRRPTPTSCTTTGSWSSSTPSPARGPSCRARAPWRTGDGDQVWVRLYKRERQNAAYSDSNDAYITFNGYLIKPGPD